METESTQNLKNQSTPDAAIEQANSLRKFTIKTQKLLLLQVAVLIICTFVCLEESTLNLFHHQRWVNERENITFDTYCRQYSQCRSYEYYGQSYRQGDLIAYNHWLNETKKVVYSKQIILYIGLLLLPLDLLVTLGFKMFSQEKLKKIQITHYCVQSFLLAYFTWSVLSVVRFEQYFIKTILILLYQLIVVFITNLCLLLNNMYFKKDISLKILQYVVNGIMVGFFIVVQFTNISRLLYHQLAISVYLIYYFLQLDSSIQQIEEGLTQSSIWSNVASGIKNIFIVNEHYQEIAMTHFVISKQGLFKCVVASIGILISMVLSYTVFNKDVFYLLSYIFISTLSTLVQDTQIKNRLQPSEEYYCVTQIPLDILMPARNLLRSFKH